MISKEEMQRLSEVYARSQTDLNDVIGFETAKRDHLAGLEKAMELIEEIIRKLAWYPIPLVAEDLIDTLTRLREPDKT
jgi:hypothetical protein